MKNLAAAVLCAIALSACTSVRVVPFHAGSNVQHVCIKHNPRVKPSGFLPMLEEGFARHGVTTEVFHDSAPHCEYVLAYTALWTWDIAVYLYHADLVIVKNNDVIASATYHLNAGGGLSLLKWASTKSKIDPVIDELFKNMGTRPVTAAAGEYRHEAAGKPTVLGPIPLPSPVSASAPSPAPVPVRVMPVAPAAPAARQPLTKRPETGMYAYSATLIPEARDCTDPVTQLTARGVRFEMYVISCADGKVLSVRCEPGRCWALK